MAKIVLGPESMISCMVRDISTGGARIALDRPMDLPDDFDLFIAAHDLQFYRARLRWRRDDSLGVSFVPAADQPEHARIFLPWIGKANGSFGAEVERVRVEVERDATEPQVFTRRVSA